MTPLLGIDNGLPVTRVVTFDQIGQVLSTTLRRVTQSVLRSRHVERDVDSR